MHTPHVAMAALSGWTGTRAIPAPRAGTGPATTSARFIADTLPLSQFVALTEDVARAVGDDTHGWALGLQYELAELGPVARAIRSAPTLGAALRMLVDFFSLMQDSSEMQLACEEGWLTVSYRILDPEIWPRHQDAIFTLGIVAQLVRLAAGPCWDKLQLGLERDDAEALARLAQRSGVRCTGGTTSNWLRIPLALAETGLPRSSAGHGDELKALNRLLVQKQRTTTVEERVRALVYRQLGDRPISQEQIARSLGMSSRTLRRHLAASATSFQDLVDDCRLRQAAHEFRVRRNVSIAQTALRLGYSEHSTFTRAFARWCGMAPQSFMRAHAPT